MSTASTSVSKTESPGSNPGAPAIVERWVGAHELKLSFGLRKG